MASPRWGIKWTITNPLKNKGRWTKQHPWEDAAAGGSPWQLWALPELSSPSLTAPRKPWHEGLAPARVWPALNRHSSSRVHLRTPSRDGFQFKCFSLTLFGLLARRSWDIVISVALVVQCCGADPCRCSPSFSFQFSPSTIHLADFPFAGFILSDLGTLLAFVGPCLSHFIFSELLFRSRAIFFCLLCLFYCRFLSQFSISLALLSFSTLGGYLCR